MRTGKSGRIFRAGSIALGAGVSVATLLGGSAVAYGAETEPTNPQNFGETFGNNDHSGGGAKTLYETYNSSDYVMPVDTSWNDFLAEAVNGAADFLFFLAKSIVSAVITMVSWLFDMTNDGGVTDNLSGMIGGTASAFMIWLLPTALAAGAFVAYLHAKRDGVGGAVGQLVWVALAGLFTVSLAMTPAFWTTTTDTVRTLAVDSVNTATADALTVNEDFPFSFENPDFSGGDETTSAQRKISDGLWRNFVAMPWCMSTLGSIEACERYGQDILDKRGDDAAILHYIKNDMADQEGGEDSPTVRYAKGHEYWERLGQATMVCAVSLVMAIGIVVLGFGAFAAMVLSWLLLAIGGFFAVLCVIPGVLREWGKKWFFALVGALAGAAVKMLVFQAVVLVVIGALATDWPLGIRTLVAIVIVIAGLGLNRTLDGIVGHSGNGMLRTAATGYMAGRALKGAAGGAFRIARGAGSAGLGGLMAGGRGLSRAASARGQGGAGTSGAASAGTTASRLQDLGERSAPRTRQFQVQGAPAPQSASRPALGGAGMRAGSAKPARALPQASAGGQSRSGVAFQGERGSIPMPATHQNTPVGREAMRVDPAPRAMASASRHGSINAARPSGLPDGPRRSTRSRGALRQGAPEGQRFRTVPPPTVIRGEVVEPGNSGSGQRARAATATTQKGAPRPAPAAPRRSRRTGGPAQAGRSSTNARRSASRPGPGQARSSARKPKGD